MQRRQRSEGRAVQSRPEPGQKARQADAARRDGQRRGEAQLPDVEKAEPVAGALGAVDLAQKCIRAASAREGRAQLGPHQPVGHGDGRAQHPCPHREPEARRGNHQRQRDERADADHLQHVEENGGAQPDAALEGCGTGGRGRLERHEAIALTGLYTDGRPCFFPSELTNRAVDSRALAGACMAGAGPVSDAQQATADRNHALRASTPPRPATIALPLPEDRGQAGLEQTLKRLGTTASVLMIVAHPDDEDGALLTYLSRGLGARATLLHAHPRRGRPERHVRRCLRRAGPDPHQ